MIDFLNNILDNCNIPIVTAFVLGLLTAVSPCPLATNITAVGFISKDIEHRRKVFIQGAFYTFGRIFSYSILGFILIFILRKGLDTFELQETVSNFGEIIIGPILIVIGLFMLFGHLLHLPRFGFGGNTETNNFKGRLGAFLLGILFAMAFCPTSGLLYFGMLIPMAVESSIGYLLPMIFAIATSLPVIIIAFIIAFSMKNLSRFLGGIKIFQIWFNRIVATIFILVGCYYSFFIFM